MNVTASSTTPSGTQLRGKQFALKSEDFIKMMITQLQNQDPLEPAKNEQLLTQMSQIGQLQASTDLQNSLRTLVLQNNLSSAGNMIGKVVNGQDRFGEPVSGLVTSVRVESGNVWLELDSGKTLPLSSVTSIAAAA